MEDEKKKAIIVDLDGTIADIEHRIHHIQKDPPNWKDFHAEVDKDTPIEWCVDLVNKYSGTDTGIIFVTARYEYCREETIKWLKRHDIPSDHIHMRKDDDHRPDIEVKQEIYQQHIEPHYDVLFALEDRPRVCRMWRALGLTVLQCNDIEF